MSTHIQTLDATIISTFVFSLKPTELTTDNGAIYAANITTFWKSIFGTVMRSNYCSYVSSNISARNILSDLRKSNSRPLFVTHRITFTRAHHIR